MRQTKPTLYPDTNILSVLHYRGAIPESLVLAVKTLDWWSLERRYFSLFGSKVTESELERGVYKAKDAALASVRRLPYLTVTSEVKKYAEFYVRNGVVPSNKFDDAIQLAMATAHRIDYLLTWNFAHLANEDVFRKLLKLNAAKGWRSPLLVSPESIPWVSLGQDVRRHDD